MGDRPNYFELAPIAKEFFSPRRWGSFQRIEKAFKIIN